MWIRTQMIEGTGKKEEGRGDQESARRGRGGVTPLRQIIVTLFQRGLHTERKKERKNAIRKRGKGKKKGESPGRTSSYLLLKNILTEGKQREGRGVQGIGKRKKREKDEKTVTGRCFSHIDSIKRSIIGEGKEGRGRALKKGRRQVKMRNPTLKLFNLAEIRDTPKKKKKEREGHYSHER